MRSHRRGPVTKRLVLRAKTVEDAEAFYELMSDPEVMRFTGDEPIGSVEEGREAIANYPDFETVGYGRWGCYLRGEQTLCGFCGLKYLDDLEEVDLGYRFLPRYWGAGLATEACEACVRFGFEILGLQRIIALVLPENLVSIRVLQKVGMKEEEVVQYDDLRPIRYAIHPAEE